MTGRIAYIHSRLQLNNARLKYMPFGFNLAQKLDQLGHSIDFYLAEDATDDYTSYFSDRTRFFFLDQPLIWKRPGKLTFYLLHLYTQYLVKKSQTRYRAVLSSGQAGNCLGSKLAQSHSCPFIFLSDEFPDIYDAPLWENAEAQAARQADLLISPDESRCQKLTEKIEGISQKPSATIPNTPLADAFENLPEIDWHERLGLPAQSKIFLLAGGIHDYNQVAETLFTAADWPEEAVLLVNGKTSRYVPKSSYDHLDVPGKIFWHTDLFDDPEFHSLVKASTGSFGLYRHVNDLDYVGKSSGKILRSLACGRPVIASNFHSLDFISRLDLGKQVTHPREIPGAVKHLIDQESFYAAHCPAAYQKHLSFEAYWPQISLALEQAGLQLN